MAVAAARKTILISGASIAGPALALSLLKHGTYKPVIVERSPQLRLGGQNVDVEGAAHKVTQLLDLDDAIRKQHTGELGIQTINLLGAVSASFPVDSAVSITKNIEIVRGDLSQLLYDRTADHCEYMFGDFITSIDDRAADAPVTVSFASGLKREFDLVVAADGTRSPTRQLIVNNEAELRPVGLWMAYFTVAKGEADTQWASWYTAPNSRAMILRPARDGTTRACFAFMSERTEPPKEVKEWVADVYADAGWETPRVVQGMKDADDVYCEYLSQVFCPRWSNGRCALVGDAAHAPTPITGQGTSLAILGAYILAGELSKYEHHREALESYEALLRSHVEKCQQIYPFALKLLYPKTELGVWTQHKVAGIIAQISKRFPNRDTAIDSFELPVYPSFDK